MTYPYPRTSARCFVRCLLATLLLSLAISSAHAQQFKDFVIFGDSLSDVGNIADRTDSELGISYPSPDFGYTDGRFTDGKDTDPAARTRKGVWHEQLAKKFLKITSAKASLDSGLDYAFGGAKTIDGTTKRAVVEDPLFGNEITVTIDNMGKQVDDYLNKNTPSADSLFIVWGGSNDLLDNPDSDTVTATATNVGNLVTRLAQAGASSFLVPNVPPLNLTPNNNADKVGSDKNAALAQASFDYREALNAMLDTVQANLETQGITVTIYRLDVYGLFLDLVANPTAYGIANISDAAQDQDSDVNPDRYLSWDGLHPTTIGHYQLAAEAYTALTGTPVVSINTLDSSITEVNGLGNYYLTRTGDDLSSALTVPYAVSGSATPGTDYKMFKGAKTMKPGKRFVRIKLQAFADTNTKEDDEEVTLTIGEGAGYKLGTPTAATIEIDNQK